MRAYFASRESFLEFRRPIQSRITTLNLLLLGLGIGIGIGKRLLVLSRSVLVVGGHRVANLRGRGLIGRMAHLRLDVQLLVSLEVVRFNTLGYSANV